MKVFVAGASGVVGRRLLPALRSRGYEIVAMTRSPDRAEGLRWLGAEPVVADALDRDAVVRAMERTAPDAVVHQLTDLRDVRNYRKFDDEFAGTNRLRTEGTENLLAGARAAGARRFVAQSFGGWIYERTGSRLKTEADRLDPQPPRQQRKSLAAIRRLEETVTGAADLEGIALRYGYFYGAGTALAPGGDLFELVRKRSLPIVGTGAGVWCFVHVDDAAEAAAAALTRGVAGVYNIADDDPAPVAEWVPALARLLNAPPPRRVPTWIGRLASGEVGVSMMTRVRGMSNAKARSGLGWEPRYGSWREGFEAVFRGSETDASAFH